VPSTTADAGASSDGHRHGDHCDTPPSRPPSRIRRLGHEPRRRHRGRVQALQVQGQAPALAASGDPDPHASSDPRWPLLSQQRRPRYRYPTNQMRYALSSLNILRLVLCCYCSKRAVLSANLGRNLRRTMEWNWYENAVIPLGDWEGISWLPAFDVTTNIMVHAFDPTCSTCDGVWSVLWVWRVVVIYFEWYCRSEEKHVYGIWEVVVATATRSEEAPISLQRSIIGLLGWLHIWSEKCYIGVHDILRIHWCAWYFTHWLVCRALSAPLLVRLNLLSLIFPFTHSFMLGGTSSFQPWASMSTTVWWML
jgi:hypothetical protein